MPKEKTREELKAEKRATLTTFSRLKKGDSDVIEEVTQILTEDKLKKLAQAELDHQAEITRRTDLLEKVKAEIASLK
jgi:hypothetical protein